MTSQGRSERHEVDPAYREAVGVKAHDLEETRMNNVVRNYTLRSYEGASLVFSAADAMPYVMPCTSRYAQDQHLPR